MCSEEKNPSPLLVLSYLLQSSGLITVCKTIHHIKEKVLMLIFYERKVKLY